MKGLRNLLLFAIAAALLSSVINTGTNEAAPTPSQPDQFARQSDQQIELYVANKEAIDKVWVALPAADTLKDAIRVWTASLPDQSQPRPAICIPDPSQHAEAEEEPAELYDQAPIEQVAATSPAVCTAGRCPVARATGYTKARSQSFGSRRFGWRVRAVGRFLFRGRR
jgi:hypothetical protein